MSIITKQISLIPIRRDKQVPITAGVSSSGGGGSSSGGGSSLLSGSTYVLSGNTQIFGSLMVTGDICAYWTSDNRLKNIQESCRGLEIIKKLQPVTYTWNDLAKELYPTKDDNLHFGLVAQEVEKVAPEIVHQNNNEFKTIDYVELIPILIQAVKEQQKQIKDLTEDLEYYKNYNRGL